MTNEASIEEPVHFWPPVHEGAARPWPHIATQWAEVTCGDCRLEQPMDRTGMPERGLAPSVEAHLLAERIAKVVAVQDEALEEIRHFTVLLADALALRARLAERLSALGGSPKEFPRYAPAGAVQDLSEGSA